MSLDYKLGDLVVTRFVAVVLAVFGLLLAAGGA
jgi:hypothetical protein